MNIRFHIGKNAIALSVQRDDDGITISVSNNKTSGHNGNNNNNNDKQ